MHVIDQVLARFPEKVATVRRLYLRDERFRSVCEDYVLCVDSLRRFEDRYDASTRPEVTDFRQIQRELEHELRSYLTTAEPDC